MELFSGSKLVHHFPIIEEWRCTGTSKPILLEIDMTNQCDHRCPHCVCLFARNTQQLSILDAKKVILQAKDLGIKAVVFTGGGEPLLNSYTPDVIEFSRRLGLDVGLITNGSSINREIAKIIVQNSTWCRVSLDASNPYIYKLMHGVDIEKWKRAIEGISLLVEEKSITDSKATIGLGYLVSEQNVDNLLEVVQLSEKLGVNYIQIRPLRNSIFDVRNRIMALKESVNVR